MAGGYQLKDVTFVRIASAITALTPKLRIEQSQICLESFAYFIRFSLTKRAMEYDR